MRPVSAVDEEFRPDVKTPVESLNPTPDLLHPHLTPSGVDPTRRTRVPDPFPDPSETHTKTYKNPCVKKKKKREGKSPGHKKLESFRFLKEVRAS